MMPNRRLSRLLRALHLRQGRRGAFLVLFGAAYVLLGYSYLAVTITPAVHQALQVALSVAPLAAYGWAWLICGIFVLIGGFFLPPNRDRYVFGAAATMPTLWSFVYFAGWIHGDQPRGWTSGLLFLVLAGSVSVVAGMIDPAVTKWPPA